MKRTILVTAISATLSLASMSANALVWTAPVGIDFDGAGTTYDFMYSNRWVELTDTGVDVSLDQTNGTVFEVGDRHQFQSQHRVGSYLDSVGDPLAFPTTPFGAYQITQTVFFYDQVKAYTPNNTDGGTVEFQYLANEANKMSIWLDDITDGSKAVPTGANCYGAGKCVDGNGNAIDDGVEIMKFSLIGNTSSFTATTSGTGTGQFDLIWELTYFNPLYVDPTSAQGMLAYLRFTGTLAQPLGGTPSPGTAWNGTTYSTDPTSPNQIFKIDGSKDFAVVPEPGTVALLGLGLAGLGFLRRRKS